MTEFEITDIPPLTETQRSLLDMHSLLNVLNVIWTELAVIGLALTRSPIALSASHDLVEQLKESIGDPLRNLGSARDLERYLAVIDADIAAAYASHPETAEHDDAQQALHAYTQACAVLRVRARELLARAGFPELWTDLSPKELEADLRQVFDAMVAASSGRYGVVYDPAAKGGNDYLVTLRFQSDASPGRLQLPLVFKDVMRDLIANARKYTAPGGAITATLVGRTDALEFEVTDTGWGIPPSEICSVAGFGVRGSNVQHMRTMGGGFGLTKAFLVTKQLGGRFWIASELGVGTRIRIRIPMTAARFARRFGF